MKSVLLLASVLSAVSVSAAVKDVTSKMENLGIPYAQRFADKAYNGSGCYARNVWALKAFEGRLYIGAGNSSNGGPASNAGPVPVISYSPKTKKFETEWTVPDEQIDIFHVLGKGDLYIPGHDPKEDWSLGNLYRRAAKAKGDKAWEKLRSLPDGVHCYDCDEFDGKIIACGYGTYESSDNGKTFSHKNGSRYYSLFRFPKSIYAMGVASPEGTGKYKGKDGKERQFKRPAYFAVSRKQSGKDFEICQGAKSDNAFPDTPELKTEQLKACRPSAIKDRLVYIGGIVHNDHQIQPLAAYTAVDGPSMFKAERVKLPEGAVPWYTASVGKKVLILWATKDGRKQPYVNHVSSSTDGVKFIEEFVFESPTFARSVEYLDGCLYFGLGTEIKEHGHFEGNSLKLKFAASELDHASGTLLRCRYTP